MPQTMQRTQSKRACDALYSGHAPGGAAERRSWRSSRERRLGGAWRELATGSTSRRPPIRRDLEFLEQQRLLTPHPRRRGGPGRPVRAAAALQERAPPGGEEADRRRGGRARRRRVRRSGSPAAPPPPRWRARVIDRQRLTVVTNALNIAQRAGRAAQPEAGRHGRLRASRVLRAGGPPRRASARRAQPGRRRSSVWTASRPPRASPPTTRWRRTRTCALIERARRVVVVTDSSKIGLVGVRADLPDRSRARGDHRRRAPTRLLVRAARGRRRVVTV